MKICTASGIVSRTWRAPWTSISSTTGRPPGEPPLELGAQRAVAPARVARRARRTRPASHAALELLVVEEVVVDAVAPRPAAARAWSPTPTARARARARSSVRISVPLPTPEGPVMTKTSRQAARGASGAACETQLGALALRQAADGLARRDAALHEHLVDLHAPVLRHRQQHVEDLRGLDVLRRLEQQVVDADAGPPLRSRLSWARRVRISFARWSASIRWTRERSGAATVGLVGRLRRWRHGRRVYIVDRGSASRNGANSPGPQLEVEPHGGRLDGILHALQGFLQPLCATCARAAHRRAAPRLPATAVQTRASSRGDPRAGERIAERLGPDGDEIGARVAADRVRGVRTGRRPCRRSGSRPARATSRDLRERDRADGRPGHAAGPAAEPRARRAGAGPSPCRAAC